VSLERLTPKFVERPWGSTELAPYFPNPAVKTGEVWFERDGFPLLIKFIFTTGKLSVQVHPDDDYAQQHHASVGKTEMWHVLSAQPGAQIAAGFKSPLTKEQLRASAISGEIESMLEWHDAVPGDTFFLPAGTVHAIGAGLVLCEIQQHSDLTYRLYDYGRPRELHLEHAMQVSELDRCDPRAKQNGSVLVSCRYFITDALSIKPGAKQEIPAEKEHALVVLEGSGTIADNSVQAGEVWYARPQSVANIAKCSPHVSLSLLRVCLP
jgi:mannose-6-phosphate isomerase